MDRQVDVVGHDVAATAAVAIRFDIHFSIGLELQGVSIRLEHGNIFAVIEFRLLPQPGLSQQITTDWGRRACATACRQQQPGQDDEAINLYNLCECMVILL
jgi:hypothetical protein